MPWEEKALLEESLEALKASVVDVNVVPDLDQYRLLNQGISEWGGLPVSIGLGGVLLSLVAAAAAGVGAGVLPALKAAGLTPIDALRAE